VEGPTLKKKTMIIQLNVFPVLYLQHPGLFKLNQYKDKNLIIEYVCCHKEKLGWEK